MLVLDEVVDVLVVDVEVLLVDVDVVDRLVDVVGRVEVVVEDEVVLDEVVDVTEVGLGALSSFVERNAKMIRTTATATMRIATPHSSGLRAALVPPPAGGAVSGGVPSGGTGPGADWGIDSVACGSTTGICSVGSSAPGNSPGPLPSFGVSVMTRTLLVCRSAPPSVVGGTPAARDGPIVKKPRKNLLKTGRNSTFRRRMVQG